MTTAAEAVALFPPDPAPRDLSARDRRKPYEDLPTIPVNGGMELTEQEAAAILFDSFADTMRRRPGVDQLSGMLRDATRTLGGDGIREATRRFATIEDKKSSKATTCRENARRLTHAFWYADARSREMTAGEFAVCLYFSTLPRARLSVWRSYDNRHRQLTLFRSLYQGVDALPARMVVDLGHACGQEESWPEAHPRNARRSTYRRSMPDYLRRRFCWSLATSSGSQPAPLVVRFDDGSYQLGLGAQPFQTGPYATRTRDPWR